MRRQTGVLSFAVAVFAACQTTAASDAGFPAVALTTATTDDGLLQVALRTSPTQPPPRANAKLDVLVTDAQSKPVDGLTVTVLPWMPAMNHGSDVAPTVTPQGDGHYLAQPLELFMAGTWQLRISLQKGAQESHVQPTVDVP